MATAAMAILFLFGPSSGYLVPMGVGCAVVFVLALLFSIDLWGAIACTGTCAVLISLLGLGGPWTWPAAGVLTTILTFSFLRVYGFGSVFVRGERTQAASGGGPTQEPKGECLQPQM